MKAIVITKPGGPEVLELLERPTPEPGLNQIRVRVRTSALNRADLMQRQGNYPAPLGSPADIPGMEYAGEVDALGPGAALWEVGRRVMGIAGGGAHAEFLCVHEREVLPMPEKASWEEGGAIPEVFLTAYDALFHRLHATLGERLVVHAIGSGVGTAALQLAQLTSLTVFGTSRSADKLRKAQSMGLHHAIDASQSDWAARVEELAGPASIHAVMDLVGGGYLPGNLRVLGQRGRLAIVGLTAGRTSELDMRVVLNKRLQIVGTMLRSRPSEEKMALAREFSERVVPLFDSGRLRAVIERVVSFSEIRDAHRQLESGDTFGKLVLRWD
jgi:putative PIG3 family NAD(P)H quinone oxidoreductase